MDKREQIIEVATKLFSKKGFENTPLSEVCEMAHVSKGLIFHHFKSKNDLLREIFSKTTQLIVEINSTSETDYSPREKLLELIKYFFNQLEIDKLFFQLNLSMMLQPNTREVLNDLIKERSSFILNSVKAIFDQIDAERSEVLSYMFAAELDGIALNYLCIFDQYPFKQIETHLIEKYTEL